MPFPWEFESSATYAQRQPAIDQSNLRRSFEQQSAPPVIGGIGNALGGLGRATEGPRNAVGGLAGGLMDMIGAGPGASQAAPPAPGMGRSVFSDRPLPPPGKAPTTNS